MESLLESSLLDELSLESSFDGVSFELSISTLKKEVHSVFLMKKTMKSL